MMQIPRIGGPLPVPQVSAHPENDNDATRWARLIAPFQEGSSRVGAPAIPTFGAEIVWPVANFVAKESPAPHVLGHVLPAVQMRVFQLCRLLH